jgi:hypothetical protein
LGVNCHASDVPTEIEVISNWQLWLEPTTTWPSTGLVSAPQLSDWLVGPLAESVQFPGPRSGTSTDSKPGLSAPDSSPLIALAFEIGATGFAVDLVTLEKLLSSDDVLFQIVVVVAAVFAATITGVDTDVVGTVDVVEFGTCVVTGDVEEGGGDEAARTRGADVAVRVNTRMISRSGLDHIKRWALFSEKGERVIVFVG